MKTQNIFYKRIKCLSMQQSLSINQLEKELGYPRNSLHSYKENREPSAQRLIEISLFFKVSPFFLLGIEDIDSRPKNLESAFERLSEKQKKQLAELIFRWIESKI
ncbi:helix-turn-helix domain-containing protein [Lactococcus cremoris]|nr:helix-turn-helix domain-containing protein [Lactococcus cremoris]